MNYGLLIRISLKILFLINVLLSVYQNYVTMKKSILTLKLVAGVGLEPTTFGL